MRRRLGSDDQAPKGGADRSPRVFAEAGCRIENPGRAQLPARLHRAGAAALAVHPTPARAPRETQTRTTCSPLQKKRKFYSGPQAEGYASMRASSATGSTMCAI